MMTEAAAIVIAVLCNASTSALCGVQKYCMRKDATGRLQDGG